MANPNLNEKPLGSQTSSKLQDATNSIRDTARESMRTVGETGDRSNRSDASEMMDRASETASQFYDQAQDWMRDNSRTMYMVGGVIAVGLVGFLIGRSFSKRSSEFENF